MQHELLFRNPIFNMGLNVTIRNGDKWRKVNIGDKLLLKGVESKNNIIEAEKTGTLVGKALLPFHLIPNDLLKYEHDPACRTPAGLLAEMKRVYPDFSYSNVVTVILFTLNADLH